MSPTPGCGSPPYRAGRRLLYFTLHGGPADATLVSVTSDVSIRAEMHESMQRDPWPR